MITNKHSFERLNKTLKSLMKEELCHTSICITFNFKFNISTDKYVADSINLLKDAGIDFKSLNDFGINPLQFAD